MTEALTDALEHMGRDQLDAERRRGSKSCLVCKDYLYRDSMLDQVYCPHRRVQMYTVEWDEASYPLTKKRAQTCSFYSDMRP